MKPSPCIRLPAATRVRHAFTLVELLTVIAIIGILAAILIPTVGAVRKTARDVRCKSNLRQLGVAVHLYAGEHKNLFPGGNIAPDPVNGIPRITWDKALIPYLGRAETNYEDSQRSWLVVCPSSAVQPDTPDPQYSANKLLFSASNSPLGMDRVENRSLVVMIADGCLRTDQVNTQAHAVLETGGAGLNVSTSDPDQAVSVTYGDSMIDYRHGGDSTHVVMVDASVRAFKKGTLRSRNFLAGD
ncbi:prepilin-type N-terminal cleavage/methylation domain-containing protein [Opitutaceae bacterium TAV1]|nr:prepilin-type N-terminal cleavage/methylation domain-containing protein [Opitutaceae bacterium TAV1]